MKKIKIYLWMLVCVFFLGHAVSVQAEDTGSATDYSQEESYLTMSFEKLLKSGDLIGESGVTMTDSASNNGIVVTGNSSIMNDAKFKIRKTFHFDGNRVGRIALNALAGKEQDLTLELYLDDETKSFASISLLKQGREGVWTRDITLNTDVLSQNIKGDHSISFSVVNAGEGSTTVLLRSIEFVENDCPTIYMTLDESLGTVKSMNTSEFHTEECYGSMSVEVPAGYTYEYGENAGQTATADTTQDYELSYLRGRGNSTWQDTDKKPYKLKLEKRKSILGMGANKNWALLANAFDNSKMRNQMTYWLGNQLGMAYSPKSVAVDLVVNGIYFGNYFLTETIRVDENRLNIEDLEASDETKAATDTATISGGYLLSYNGWSTNEKSVSFNTTHDLSLSFESPSFDDYRNETQISYMENYVQKTEDAIYADNFKDKDGVSYTEYLDVDAAVDYYWIQEVSMNGDAYGTDSTYMYKTRNGKLCFGPLWDFDYVAWNSCYGYEDAAGFVQTDQKWFTRLLKDPSFVDALEKRWPAIREKLLLYCEEGGQIDTYYDQMDASLRYDYEMWGHHDFTENHGWTQEQHDEIQGVTTPNSEKERLRTWIQKRVAWIDANIDCLELTDVKLTFKVDNATYITMNVARNTAVSSLPKAPDKSGYLFAGWIIEGDDSNDYIIDGSSFIRDTTLKAVYVSKKNLIVPTSLYLSDSEMWLTVRDENEDYCYLYSSVYPAGAYHNVTYCSSNENVVEVDSKGKISIISEGVATITVSCANLKRSCKVHVINSDEDEYDYADEVWISSSKLSMKKGQLKQLTVKSDQEHSRYVPYQWYSMNSSVASVDKCGVVHAKKNGTALILLMTYGGETIKQCKVTVGATSTKSSIKKGYTYTYKGLKYKVTSKATKGGTVTVLGPTGRKIKSVNIRTTLKIKGETFKVTAISYKAFYKCKKLKKVYLGKNLKSIGSKAFTGINKHARFRVPSSKKKAYKKLLTSSRGFKKKTMKIYQ